ncbi:MAG: di-trans,poly-cis-decaprenylcistransferase [Candidatus Staskawiczbacteria bacterium RIFOXYB2_FULL_32_9]|uniref:Isoprenyl transferase n=1 Tax=Candidatus Staskawiczbacteria bacterium RIFOXYD1_FULL_32_13 TaxID=1802234 RepID=A0A1G2JR81_9BACT|nr:MAG: Isoprenyl transferase [Parcubacteria group bacterium GW2011_GWC2_32_10]OGZ77415.1 MAG: di-trans,poly-cis-decaprenylcistransferase [Candidatus Staskawiczbacteria bacterium RIFOXYA2_FULL_32_7]OGZ79821.1 MAG: di-trans,poly-cis-decaprenylcistransferase [Candidatus Staskawiczbacteria bacterium RIFOXYB1_FULL_32_11]OGZ81043.1 MAG: di-trans,poly-cis-decaprenylcistransferase [Candidatus Staskawiczbacteria bacterium RIFOXYB2_FULL_32_9]OGZ89659.1 MAG: di-trans,poly-cis-decaprenylcistransferase [Ca
MNIPQHIVLFPDGNRRWAREKGLNTLEGHMQGYKNLLDFSKWCKNKGVKVLTAFGFSTENWNRSPEEVSYLMNLLEKCLIDNLESYNKNGTCVRVIGQKDRLPKSLQDAIIKTEESTKNNSSLFLNLAISYGGKWDILNAVKKIVEEKISVDDINEKLFDSYLSTAGLKDPDLVIRAGGEMRMSNFVLWQAVYSELYFSSKYWPDFTEQDLDLALQEFDKRSRRFGK